MIRHGTETFEVPALRPEIVVRTILGAIQAVEPCVTCGVHGMRGGALRGLGACRLLARAVAGLSLMYFTQTAGILCLSTARPHSTAGEGSPRLGCLTRCTKIDLQPMPN